MMLVLSTHKHQFKYYVVSWKQSQQRSTNMVLTCRTSSQQLHNIDWLFWLVGGSSGMRRSANARAWSIIRQDSQEFQIFFSSWSATQPFLCSGQGVPPSPPAATCLSLGSANNYCEVKLVLYFRQNDHTLFSSLFHYPHFNPFFPRICFIFGCNLHHPKCGVFVLDMITADL